MKPIDNVGYPLVTKSMVIIMVSEPTDSSMFTAVDLRILQRGVVVSRHQKGTSGFMVEWSPSEESRTSEDKGGATNQPSLRYAKHHIGRLHGESWVYKSQDYEPNWYQREESMLQSWRPTMIAVLLGKIIVCSQTSRATINIKTPQIINVVYLCA